MRHAHFDCSYGLAGDMILGALVDAGLPFESLKKAIETDLNVEGIRLEHESVTRAGVTATRVHVVIDHAEDKHRHLRHVVEIINGSNFSQAIKDRANKAFRRIAEAEAHVHGTTVEKIHFHEVGCLDAIADVTGAMFGIEALGIESVTASPIATGTGTTHCAHGDIPVPAPATVEILKGIPTRGTAFQMEMTTPTGAAVIATLADSFGPQPEISVRVVGCGSGTREIEGHANFLRILLGETEQTALPGGLHSRSLTLLTTEIDDMNPELLGALMEHLFDGGCLDAHFTPIQMKKNRPATQIQVLCDPAERNRFIEILIRETSTFGVKVFEMERVCLPRRKATLKTTLGEIEAKVGLWDDAPLKVTPEYEDCRALAKQHNIPLSRVYEIAIAAIQAEYEQNQ